MICKICNEEKELDRFPATNSKKGKTYYLKTCYVCRYKKLKEDGKTVAYHKTHPEQWNEYQKEYARVKYYDYYKKRGQENERTI